MFKRFLFAALFAASHVSAMPNGEYLLATPVLDTENVIPRYIHLNITDAHFDVSYVSPIHPDLTACKLQNHCEGVWSGLSVAYTDTNDRLSIGAIQLTRDDNLSELPELWNDPNADLIYYISPLLQAMNGGKISVDADSGHLQVGGLQFVPMSLENTLKLRAYILSMEVSFARLNYCEVPQFAALLASETEDDFLRGLDYFVAMADLHDQVDKYSAFYGVTATEADLARLMTRPSQIKLSALSLTLSNVVNGDDFDTAYQDAIDVLTPILADERLTFEEVIGPVRHALPAAAELQRNFISVLGTEPDIVGAICADLTLGR